MRELVFDLEYAPGCNDLADTLAEYPDTRIRSLSLHATTDSLWRVDHVTGSKDALTAIEEAFLATDYYTDCLTPDQCGASQTTQVLESTDKMLVLYSYWERTSSCASVPHMALERLGDGVLFETHKEKRRYTWRIVHSGDGDVRAFFDDLEASVADCVDIDFQRLTDASSPVELTTDGDELSPAQEKALQAAVEHGYYEQPREIDVEELADYLDVARSTLNHRLRRAEEHLAKQEVAQMRSLQRPSSD
ncbi:MAG: helix-turn-helix domain-containing protein [Halobacteriales archaeon]